jgi:hypothetical protein
VLCFKVVIRAAQWASALGSAALIKMRYVLSVSGITTGIIEIWRIWARVCRQTEVNFARYFQSNAQVYSHKRKNFNQKCRFSHQTRKFVFENVKSCGKSEKNLEKCIETVKICIETVEKIGLFFTPLRI